LPPGPIKTGQNANLTTLFGGGSEFWYMPQGGVSVTIIASDGSSALITGPVGGGFLTTARSPVPLISIVNASLAGGKIPVLSAYIRFNSSSPISEVDFYINGAYMGTTGAGHNGTAPGAATQYIVSFHLFIESSRAQVVSGRTYSVSITAATVSYAGTTVSESLVAG
jgi:hypothetical protein